jgi:hypothetical protein
VLVLLRMAARNMLPEVINKAARRADWPLSADEHRDMRFKKVVELGGMPNEGQAFTVLPDADPIGIKAIRTPPNGPPEVWLEDFDTDEIADDEAVAVEALLASGWEVDLD